MKKSELKALIRECIQELTEAKKVSKCGPATKKTMKGSSIGKGPSIKEGKLNEDGTTVDGAMVKKTVLHNRDGIVVLEPLTHEAMCVYGANSRWCVSGTGKSALFDQYRTRGRILVVIKTSTKERWAVFIPNNKAEPAKMWTDKDKEVDMQATLQSLGLSTQLFEGKKVSKSGPAVKKVTKGTSIGKGPSK